MTGEASGIIIMGIGNLFTKMKIVNVQCSIVNCQRKQGRREDEKRKPSCSSCPSW
jgi:hypothetical protein